MPTRVDFSKLCWGTLRKYQYYFKVKVGDGSLSPTEEHGREAIEEAAARHFEDLEVDYDKMIYKFMKMKKEERADSLYSFRRSSKNKETNRSSSRDRYHH